MQEEYESLMTNNTWTLVPLPAGRKPISCKWVLQIKQGANGEVERYKASQSEVTKECEWK
jgi:histone deacetylase 1/2